MIFCMFMRVYDDRMEITIEIYFFSHFYDDDDGDDDNNSNSNK